MAVLGNQGWHVHDGRLMVGEKIYDPAGLLAALGSDVRIAALHVDVRRVADRYLESGTPEVAIFEAFKALNNRVKDMTGSELDGNKLMAQVFSDINPSILLADLMTESGRNIQTGFRFLFMGAASGIRNPDAHEQFKELNPEEALEMLAFASLLMRRLDAAIIAKGTP
jgi:uncharacterized protein (TIGR02391 family)